MAEPQAEDWIMKVDELRFLSLDEMPPSLLDRFRFKVERWREKASAALAAGDPSGVMRKLLLGESVPGVPSGFLRLLGFVHVFSSAGIHLYAFLAYLRFLGFQLVQRTRLPVTVGIGLVHGVAWGFFIFAWLLQGMRAGMLRPLMVLGLRALAQALGFRWRSLAPLAVSIALDLGVSLVFWFRGEGSWAPGRLHYALAVGMGLAAWEIARKRNPVLQHLALAVGSWLGTAIWDAWETGWVSAFTPVASLLTIPVFAATVFPWGLGGVAAGLVGGAFPLRLFAVLGKGSGWFLQALAGVSVNGGFLWSVGAVELVAAGLIALSVVGFRTRARAWVFVGILGSRAVYACFSSEPDLLKANAVIQLDVGQGDAALVLSARPGAVDTGPENSLRPEQWLQIFRATRVERLTGCFSLIWTRITRRGSMFSPDCFRSTALKHLRPSGVHPAGASLRRFSDSARFEWRR